MHGSAPALLQDLGGTPVPAADLHLTLCFLGEVAGRELDPALAQVRRIQPPRLQLTFRQVGHWPQSRLLCLLPDSGPALHAVDRLAMQLREAAHAAGMQTDARPFRAHLTLARKIMPAPADSWQWPLTLARPLTLSADGLVLMRSTGAGDGPRYAVVQTWKRPACIARPPA